MCVDKLLKEENLLDNYKVMEAVIFIFHQLGV